jgi:hypothetical protein
MKRRRSRLTNINCRNWNNAGPSLRTAFGSRRLKELYEEQGGCTELGAASDRSLPRKIYELKNVERQIEETLQWSTSPSRALLSGAEEIAGGSRKRYAASRYFER